MFPECFVVAFLRRKPCMSHMSKIPTPTTRTARKCTALNWKVGQDGTNSDEGRVETAELLSCFYFQPVPCHYALFSS